MHDAEYAWLPHTCTCCNVVLHVSVSRHFGFFDASSVGISSDYGMHLINEHMLVDMHGRPCG